MIYKRGNAVVRNLSETYQGVSSDTCQLAYLNKIYSLGFLVYKAMALETSQSRIS